MRILVNTRFLLTGKLEGFGRYTYELLTRLVKTHPQHEFFFAFDRAYDPSYIFAENVHALVLRPPARHPLLFWWWFEVAIPQAYRKHRCDALFSPDGFTSLSKHIDHNVVTIHDLAYIHYPSQIGSAMLWYYRRFTPKFVQAADHIVTVSETTQQDLIKHFPSAQTKSSWVHNGVQSIYVSLDEVDKTSVREQWSHGEEYFIAIGAIHPRKNIANTIRAYEVFRKETGSRIKLMLVGRAAWQTEEVSKILNQSEFSDDVISTGYVSEEDLATVLAAAQGLIYASFLEGFGLPIAEAMQCGVPVITSNRSSMLEIANNAALLVDPEDVDSIAGAMGILITDQEKRSDLIALGKERVKDFNWDRVSDHLASILFG